MPSSVIRAFDYHAEDSRLDIEFVTGRLYSYHGVPAAIAARMRKTISKGTFFNKRIRGVYAYSRRK